MFRYLVVMMKVCARGWRLVLPIIILFISTGLTPIQECELRKSKDGIKVYVCETPDSKLKSISATFQVDASLTKVASLIMDIEQYPRWQYKVVQTEMIERYSEREFLYWGEVKAPWPVSNRDLVVRMRITQDSKTKVTSITAISEPDGFPKKDGVVRVPKSETRWVLTPINDSQLKVKYYFLVDPGGSIPGWLLNLTIAEGPYQTFKNLIDQVKEDAPTKVLTFLVN